MTGGEGAEPEARGRTVRGVGGFRLGLEKSGWEVVWANQWEPATSKNQHALDCYTARFGRDDLVEPQDISRGDRRCRAGPVASSRRTTSCAVGSRARTTPSRRPLAHAHGLEGKKGVLWWEIIGGSAGCPERPSSSSRTSTGC